MTLRWKVLPGDIHFGFKPGVKLHSYAIVRTGSRVSWQATETSDEWFEATDLDSAKAACQDHAEKTT